MKKGSWYRNLVLWIVDNYLEGISIIACIGVIIGTYPLIKEEESRLLGITLLSEGIMTVFLVSWFFFCAMDIRDHLKSIVENTRKDITLNCSKKEQEISISRESYSTRNEKQDNTKKNKINMHVRICPRYKNMCAFCYTYQSLKFITDERI